jgi:diguanylate cyclase (GGDEF) domain
MQQPCGRTWQISWGKWGEPVLLGLVIFGLSLLGILTRIPGLLAALWPANAVMLGLLIRFPQLNRPAGWLMATLGYLAADLLANGPPGRTLLLTAANLSGVAVGCWLFSYRPEADRELKSPTAFLQCIWISILASLAAGGAGAVANPLVFHRPMVSGLGYWFATELVHYLAILPVLLTFPRDRKEWAMLHLHFFEGRRLMPLAALIGSLALATLLDGPGVLALPIPALLWCAELYAFFTTTLITLFTALWMLYAISTGLMVPGVDVLTEQVILSLRVGVIFITLSPLAAASMLEGRNDMLVKMAYLAEHDGLTGILNRSGFWKQTDALLHKRNTLSVSVLMLDIDNFKQLNDTHGHAAGDVVLSAFTRTVKTQLRESDLFGRTGGEEFAIVFVNHTARADIAIAQRINRAVACSQVILASGIIVSITVSIGIVSITSPEPSLDQLLHMADTALYQAKTKGRNRVEVYPA